jgi:hypothetical protein
VSDAASAPIFPRSIAGYCIDPNGETRVFGQGEKSSMDAICTEAFDGECEVYKGFGLNRVVNLRYVDGGGSPGSIDIYLSKFASADGAYSMFTKRVVADGDPAETAPRALHVGAAGALGTGRAYAYKGPYLAEIQYANEDETPAQMKITGDRVLMPLAKQIGDRMPGNAELPPSAARLPSEHLIPIGISYEPKQLLGIAGTGPGAIGFYRDGTKRYRVLSVERDDPEQAKDVLKTFGRSKGATEEKGLGDGGYHAMLPNAEGAKVEWIFARTGKRVVGVGDEAFVIKPGMSAADKDTVALSHDDKIAKLRSLLK